MKLRLAFSLAVGALISLAGCANPQAASTSGTSAPAKPGFLSRVGTSIEHAGTALVNFWHNGGEQDALLLAENEIAGVGYTMIENLVSGGKFDASADAISGTFTALHSLEGTGLPFSTGAIQNLASQQIPDPAVAKVVGASISTAVQTVIADKGLTKDQALELVANTIQPQVTAAVAASVP